MKKLLLPCMLLCIQSVYSQNCSNTSVGFTPINDLGKGTFRGYQGGLYPKGLNIRPSSHDQSGKKIASRIVPLNKKGKADSVHGKIVWLSIGLSHTTMESRVFISLTDTFSRKNPKLILVDGAQGGQDINIIDDPNAEYWNNVVDSLTKAGLTSKQVQIVWFKEAEKQPSDTAFATYPDALKLKYKKAIQILKTKFPNVRLCYIASRSYSGYATSDLNPEPYAYYSGWSVKRLIEDQIKGDTSLTFMGSHARAPWLAWGPYLWADGTTPRSDGLTWNCPVDYLHDGTHPSQQGRMKVANLLLNFFSTDLTTVPWFIKPSVNTAANTEDITDNLNGQDLQLGKQEIVSGSFYVVHSGEGNNNIVQLSNIYLIKGTNDSVWIFGSGYGNIYGTLPVDSPHDDIGYYGRQAPYRNAIDDARIVDTVIHTNFGLSRSKAKVMFITPHGHVDHINMEFLSSLFDTLGYNKNALKIFIHTNDYKLASCNKPYCGDTLDPQGKSNPYFGAPFDIPWNSTYLNKFKKLGKRGDLCNQVIKTFTSVLGTCNVVKGQPVATGGHTDGTVNIDNPDYKFRIDGAGAGKDCYVDPSWMEFHIHGPLNDTLPLKNYSSASLVKNEQLKIFPNPAHNQLNFYLSADAEDYVITVYDTWGAKIASLTLSAGRSEKISCALWQRGIYSVVYSSKGNAINKKMILIE